MIEKRQELVQITAMVSLDEIKGLRRVMKNWALGSRNAAVRMALREGIAKLNAIADQMSDEEWIKRNEKERTQWET